ncbi:N-acetylmuramic acid 6-phosphate etherase [Sporothrix schenckii 1099-18]|uniref:N-acetylmuramic acid 6-phosphate etherase n=1 Tax=Sporothrix schenckii 1099-18 TaxID=1397361 RepID=A0A0F2MLT3_SPOSC|nr:N-acetylmuramic acid 6-phosphate etherase [Sporothrix schenckii 1099-18]KJR89810.1 N-acetylmuramic acid 6-phosphate etherase [Sporothrix schenckii 1099-18]
MTSDSLASLADLQTEQRNAKTAQIDTVSTLELCRAFVSSARTRSLNEQVLTPAEIINDQDQGVAAAVKLCLPEIARAIDLVVPRIATGGRVVYIGAGTSGRLGVLDASEIPPTFSAPPSQFVGLIAGGDGALRTAVEGAEDSETLAAEEIAARLESQPLGRNDVVIGIASSGRTPYVLGGLRYAKSVGAATVGLACVQPSQMRETGLCDVLIECVTGPEVLTGSTRLKAGTATKMILNMISTGSQVRTGKTFGNLVRRRPCRWLLSPNVWEPPLTVQMIDLQMSNEKLRDRARRVLRTVVSPAGILAAHRVDEDAEVDSLLAGCDGSVKLSILVAMSGLSPDQARLVLQKSGGMLSKALRSVDHQKI